MLSMSDLALKIEKALQKTGCTVKEWRTKRIEVETTAEKLLKTIEILKSHDLSIKFLCTIVGMDMGDKLGVRYLFGKRENVIIVSVYVPYDKPEVPSLTNLIPAALLYEREVYDLVGVKFLDHPNLSRLVLPEDWPDGVHPLLKNFKYNKDEHGQMDKECLLGKAEDIKVQIDTSSSNQ